MPLPPVLPLPPFFDPRRAADPQYSPDAQALSQAAAAWRAEHALGPTGADVQTTHLLVIDAQRDFCFPQGSLYVGGRSGTGAIDDSARLAAFIHRNLARITETTCTLDSHLPFQIFFPAFWRLADGSIPAPHQAITTADVQSGRVHVNPDAARFAGHGDAAWLERQVLHYCAELERAGKYTLWLWPPHCLVGSTGHALVGVVQEARLFHAFARGAQAWSAPKGGNPLTENYSVFSPEVRRAHDGSVLGERDRALLESLLRADRLVVAGQAASHCVKSSLDDLLDAIRERDARLARKVYLLTDCMSAVTVPDGKGGFVAAFTPQADAALQAFAEAGMHLVRSTEPMESWPELT